MTEMEQISLFPLLFYLILLQGTLEVYGNKFLLGNSLLEKQQASSSFRRLFELSLTKSLSRVIRSSHNDKDGSCSTLPGVLEENLQSVLLLESEHVPSTKEEIDLLCENSNQYYKNSKKYIKCLNGLERQAFAMFVGGIKRLLRTHCSGESKQKGLETLSCVSPESLKGWSNCIGRANRQIQFVANNSTEKQLVGDLCCVYPQMHSCVDEKVKTREGCSHKGANPSRYFKNLIEFVMKETLELLCSSYRNKEDCDNKNLEGVKRLGSVGNFAQDERATFPLSPIRQVIKRLAES